MMEAIRTILGTLQPSTQARDEEGLERDGHTVLYVGAENWPFPVPLVAQGNAWRFDTAAGEQAILFRRIGENERTAIEICRELAAAARHSQAHQDDDFLGKLLADASHAGATPAQYRGYRFRVLNPGSKNFAAIAYPAAYRSSGVVTFIVGREGVVHAKDLGSSSAEAANAMTGYRSDRSWTREPDPGER